jgi:hypothetical protein
MSDDDIIHIRSSVHPTTGKPVCLVECGTMNAVLTPERVLDTARDLHTAATRAEDDIALIRVLERIGMDRQVTAGLVQAFRTERPMLPGKPALRIEAVAGAKTNLPYVHIARGSMKASLSPDDARQMAVHWTETAVASLIDVRLRYVLGDYLTPADIENVFTGLQRAGGDNTPERTP